MQFFISIPGAARYDLEGYAVRAFTMIFFFSAGRK
jgi:hypothetical protein